MLARVNDVSMVRLETVLESRRRDYPEWMAQLANEKVEIKQLDEMTDAFGNTVKVAKDKKKLSRKEMKQKARLKKLRKKRGDVISDDSDDDGWD